MRKYWSATPWVKPGNKGVHTNIYIVYIFFFLVYMCHMITHPYFYFVTLITFILIYLSYGVCFTIWGCLTEALVWKKMILFYSILFCFNCYISFHYVLFDLISLYYFGPIFSTQFCFVLFFPKYWILRASAYFFKILFNHAFDFHFWDWQTTKNNIVEIQGDFLWWCRHFYCVHCYVLLFLMLTFLVNCGSLHILTLYFFSSPNLIQAKKVTVSNHLVIIGS